ncbi:PREDICTED: agamous-like MADS-box protein AGL62 [Tarenaya hassleriana]|uniref:agamous-like MADS-box protein AGL62 n=1 Tax=Tarenaya hassleriana TaxID=28532 RepID=UPI00053C6FB1|nr:PREDICTED: agamous-like MADS-box protein AGL62 [Tarenaya hassleriana]
MCRARKSKGRRKIEMVKMNNESNLQVTFSKRRHGLFKKASELCTMCGAEVAIIVFSPGRKAFSFGHPCVDTVVDRFMSGRPHLPNRNSPTMQLIEAHRNATIRDLNNELSQVLDQLEIEKKRGQQLSRIRESNRNPANWWESPPEELDLEQLTQLKQALDDLKKTVACHASELIHPTAPPPPANFYVGNHSNSNNGAGGSHELDLFHQGRDVGTGSVPINNNSNMNPPPEVAAPYGYGVQGFKHEEGGSGLALIVDLIFLPFKASACCFLYFIVL